MALPLKILELEFTVLEFYAEYVLSKPMEGKVLEKKEVNLLLKTCQDFYQTRPFIYLSHRINDYNVDPTIYINLKAANFLGIGVICNKPSYLNTAHFEKKFSKIPYEIFTELKPAKRWAVKMVEEERKKADL